MKARAIIEAESPKGVFKAIQSKSLGVRKIEVYGRRWFNRSFGNTYFTAKIYVNGQLVHEMPMEYGYGDHYADRAADWLNQSGYVRLKQHSNGGHEPMWQYCQDRGIEYLRSAEDVRRRRDL